MAAKPTPIRVERVKLDAQGYDANGAYYGAGAPVFLVTLPDGHEQAIRARSTAAAKIEAANLLATRQAGQRSEPSPEPSPRVAAEARGRAHAKALDERRTTYTTTWTHPLTGETQRVGIRHTRDYLGSGEDHLEIESVARHGKERVPHPLSDTGYRSHFVTALALINAGGPVALVDRLLAEAMRDKAWLATEQRRRQGDLFQWAEARDQATRPAAAKQARPSPAKLRARKGAKP